MKYEKKRKKVLTKGTETAIILESFNQWIGGGDPIAERGGNTLGGSPCFLFFRLRINENSEGD